MKKLFLITSILLLSVLLFGCQKFSYRKYLIDKGFSDTEIRNIFTIKSESFHLNNDTKIAHQDNLSDRSIDDIVLNVKKKNKIENEETDVFDELSGIYYEVSFYMVKHGALEKVNYSKLLLYYNFLHHGAASHFYYNKPIIFFFYFEDDSGLSFHVQLTYQAQNLFNVNPYVGGESFDVQIWRTESYYENDVKYGRIVYYLGDNVNRHLVLEPIDNQLFIEEGSYKTIDNNFYFNTIYNVMINDSNSLLKNIKMINIKVDEFPSDLVYLTDYFDIEIVNDNNQNIIESYLIKKKKCYYDENYKNSDEDAYHYDCGILEVELKLINEDELIILEMIPFIDIMNDGHLHRGIIIGENVKMINDYDYVSMYNTIILFKE